MKVQTVIFVTVIGVASVACSTADDKYQEECVEESGMDPSVVAKSDVRAFEDDKKARCFLRCLWKKTGFVDENEDLDPSHLKSALHLPDDSPVYDLLEKCKGVKEDDPCDTAYARLKCFGKKE